jgi:hypothetical protein
MKLIHQPLPPKGDGLYIPYQYLQTCHEWHKYLPASS